MIIGYPRFPPPPLPLSLPINPNSTSPPSANFQSMDSLNFLKGQAMVPGALTEMKTALFHLLQCDSASIKTLPFNYLKHLHARLLRFGLDQNNYLLNLLLRSTFNNFHKPLYATRILNQTQVPNIFIYNTMLRGLVSGNCFRQSLHTFQQMREKQGLLPDNFTLPFVLKACVHALDFVLGVEIHTLVVKVGLESDVFVKTGLVCLYSKCGDLEDAQKAFDDITVKNVVLWTALLSGYIGFGRLKEAIDVFKRAWVAGDINPDSYTLVRVLSACTQLGDLSSGEWIHQYAADTGFGKNVFLSTALVDMYAKFGNMGRARIVFDEMPEKDIVSWSAMIQGYAANGHPKAALEMFCLMQRENLRPDRYTMVGVLSACASLGALQVGEWAVGLMDRTEFLQNPVMGTALIVMYAKCGKMISAWEVFKEMKEKDIVLWNSVISSLAMNGHAKAAFACFGEIEKRGVKPNENTFIGLLCGCTHTGLVEDGRRYFHSMTLVYSLKPTIEHYGCMVDLLGRAGLLEDAHSLIKDMPMQPNAVVWGALLSGCRLYRNTELAEYVLKNLIELEPWNSGNYVLLSNIYSANHKWDESERVRSMLNDRGMKKIPAYSWIELDGVVHEFLVGDTSHPMSGRIYAKLNELEHELRAVGYAPTTEFVLFDIEEEEKEHLLGCHSEKLALAFGLITTKSDEVIRIIKNLRVCGDCHAAIKLISKITGREIIVRDNNRFHHFSDGSCSCQDYW